MGSIHLVELPNGHVIWARISSDGPTDTAGGALASIFDSEEFLKTVSGIAETVHDSVAKLRPDSVGVEFGIELSVKSGKLIGVLADIGGSTSLKISLGWDSSARPTSPTGVTSQAPG